MQALRAKKASLEAERAVQQQIAADAALYRDALKQVPEAGMPLDPAEVTARVTKATDGVAISVTRTPSGVDVTLSGPASPARAAVALAQLAQYLPDLSLRSASLEANGFTAKGSIERPAPASVPATSEQRKVVPFTEARKLRDEVAALEREIASATVDADLLQRGPAALRALQSPDLFRQQAAVVQRLVSGTSPLATTAELTFEPALISARGTLVPGRKVLDGLPPFKADYDAVSMSENAGRFELKLQPRATGR
ncbi:MAG TPA: hypothetical protein VIG99_02600 [Myxococcaceae bacterium]